uniref:Integrase catalytic domain-containing protein n=1 Tax=Tanacetum cinerariifolium TaxID=118510 RepID=A0A699GKY8_TANCI|nr:hypothetical protein [Tanacetum cinerariifolium]
MPSFDSIIRAFASLGHDLGADNRPPMLEKDMYDSWKSRMELYMLNRQHGRMILESVESGPLLWPTIEENGVNTKFLNTLPPEWSKFVTDVKLVRDLHTTNVDQLHAYLGQHEYHANEVCGLVVPVFQKGDDPIDAINHMMSFLTAVVTSWYPATNNQLRISSNPHQQATINNGRGEGHMSKQCTKPKRKRDEEWFQDKIALMVNLSHYGSDNLAKNSSSHALQDDLILSVIEQLKTQVVNCTKINQDNKNINEILTAELERYKNQERILKEQNNVDKASASYEQSLEIEKLKHTLFEHLKEKESLEQNVTLLKNDFQKEESRNIDRELTLEKQKTDAIVIHDSEETLSLEDESRFKMLQKQNEPIMSEKKVITKPVDYAALNQLSKDFETRFIPQTELSAEQAFWSWYLMQSEEPNLSSSTTIVEVPKELPKVSMVNSSLKKLKFHLANFDMVVKERTTATTITEGTPKCLPPNGTGCRTNCVEKNKFQDKMKNVLKDNDRLLEQTISVDIVNIVVHDHVNSAYKTVNLPSCVIIGQLRHTQEETATLREIVKSERLLNPLNTSLDYACKYTKRIQELLVILQQTCPCINDLGTNLIAVTPKNNDKKIRFTEHIPLSRNTPAKTTSSTNIVSNTPVLFSTGVNLLFSASGSQPQGNTKNDRIQRAQSKAKKNKLEDQPRTIRPSLNKKKSDVDTKAISSVTSFKLNVNADLKCAMCNGCLFCDNHDSCVLTYINSVNASLKSKSVKKPENRKFWQPTGKMFTTVGHIWRPTGRTFTLVGNVCPLTRIATTAIVPLREPILIESNTDKRVVTLVYLRKSKAAKKKFPVSNPKINKSLKFLGTVKFGNDHVAKIIDGVDLLTGSRGNNLYTLSLQDMMASSPICLLSKVSKTKSWLWHRHLSHLNFGAINHLARQGLVRGLLKLKFEKDHLCSACAMGKSTKKSHKPKSEDTNQEKLYLLHMDICGPMRVESVNGKKYILVIVDDYSRFTRVKFLRSKDETSDFTIKFLKMIQVRLKVPVRRIRTDNRTEFVNQTLCEYYEEVGISHETSVARSPEQNGVDERRNRTLIEAARTIVDHQAPEVIAPNVEVIPPVQADSTGSPSSTNVDQDAPSPSKSHTTAETQSSVIPLNVEEDNLDIEVAHIGNDLLFGVPISEVTSAQSSSTVSPQTIEPKTYKEALTQSCWIDTMQEELNEFERLEVWELVPRLDKVMVITLKWIYKVKLEELGGILKNKAHLVARCYRQEEGIDFEESFAPVARLEEFFSRICRSQEHGSLSYGCEDRVFEWNGNDLLLKYGFESCDPVDTPMVEKSKLDEDKEGKAVNPSHYRGMIGTLLYLTTSRPDLQFVICMCARYQARPTEKHVHAVKRIFRYLCGTVHRGLWYPKDSSVALTAFANADHAGCQDTRHSTSGSVQFLGERLISWSSKRQKSAAISSTEAEYIALSGCCAQILWIYHYIKEQVENEVIELYFVNTEYQLADLFTKSLGRDRIEFLISKLGMRSFTPETLQQLMDEVDE